MPVCKFFLTNSCRYGENCRFEHPYPSRTHDRYSYVNTNAGPRDDRYGYENKNSSGFRDDRYSYENKNSPGFRDDRYVYVNKNPVQNAPVQRDYGYASNQSSDDRDLVKQYVEQMCAEVSTIENCNMWPLSSMGFVKAMSIPGCVDYSFEEIRLKAYQAMASGSFSNYVLEFQSLLNNAKELRSVFYRPGKQAEQVIRDAMKASRDSSNQELKSGNPFFQQQTQTNLFGGNSLAFKQNLFGLSNDPAPGLFSSVISAPVQNSQSFNQPLFAKALTPQQQTTNSFETNAFFQNPTPQNIQRSSGCEPILVNQQQNSLIYSNMNDLTEEEIKQFRDQTFTEDQIPINPPPAELCNF